MTMKVKKIYRGLAWFFSAIIAAGTLVGCGKYGPPPSRVSENNAPEIRGYSNVIKTCVSEKRDEDIKISSSIISEVEVKEI